MRLSFDDEESFKEAAGSLRFNNPPSDPDSLQQLEVGSMPTQEPACERNTDICCDNPPLASNQNIILDVRRVPAGISSSTGSTPSEERSEDIDILANYGIIATLQLE